MSRLYTLVPLPEGPFRGLDPVSRMVFGAIWDRYKLSSYNVTGTPGDSPWYDHQTGAVFCVFSHAELAEAVGISERTVRRSLDALRDAGLLIWRKATYKGACRYYVTEYVRAYLRKQ